VSPASWTAHLSDDLARIVADMESSATTAYAIGQLERGESASVAFMTDENREVGQRMKVWRTLERACLPLELGVAAWQAAAAAAWAGVANH
jgi:hypothetical protein